ncbi:unnamed protein product, partial [Didymodactylos carnosus]
ATCEQNFGTMSIEDKTSEEAAKWNEVPKTTQIFESKSMEHISNEKSAFFQSEVPYGISEQVD